MADKQVERLVSLCLERGVTLALAESCTAGLMSSLIGEYPGVSKFFRGAVVCYSGLVKEKVLGVPLPLLRTHGEVSLPVALAMAKGVRQKLFADWSVSLTGIAGPGGGSPDKPVGTVCFAVVGPGFEMTSRQVFPADGGRKDIQRQAALFAFDFLLSAMR